MLEIHDSACVALWRAVKYRVFLLSVVLFPPPKAGAPPQEAAAPEAADLPQELAGVAGVSTDWWTAVQEDIRRSEYHVTWQERAYLPGVDAAYQAPNRAQNLRAYFTPQGLRLIPRVFEGKTPPWEWGLTLSGYGRSGDVRPVRAAALTAAANRIEYARGGLTEWYLNDERGLEQGFTPPETGDEVLLELTLSGSLTPHLSAAGAVEFTTPGGVTVLRYGELRAADAEGPARLELAAPHTIRIIIDDAHAVYPLTIDPLATSPSWTAESDQDYARFGSSVGTAGDVNGDGPLRDLVNTTLMDLFTNGTYDSLFQKWFPDQPIPALEIWSGTSRWTFAGLSDTLAPAAGTIQQIEARGYVIAGITDGRLPFTDIDAGGVARGFEADLIRLLAARWLGNVDAVQFVVHAEESGIATS